MFKDYDKYLKTSLKVYLFVLVIVFIMKLVGLDYFGLDLNNSDLMQELQNQDSNYLQKIIEQNEEIKKSIQEILQNVSK